ncbi:MAG: hypothetical protein GY704_15160, partial [Phycisphaeraceae bacterium]|nr:hypothetical protein [Phycisphaeraceae bacterium]
DCHDGNLVAVEILGRLAMRDGQRGEAVELAGRRVTILRKRREYVTGVQVCEETLSVPGCESLELRIHLAACLNASRQTDLALQAFENAARLAKEQGRSSELCDIYQSILRIDENHEAARKFIHDRQRGKDKRRRRRIQLISAAALMMILASMGLLTRGDTDDFDAQISQAHGYIRTGKFQQAAKAIDRLDAAMDADDERTVQVSNLRAELARRSSQAPDRGAATANALAAIVNPLLEEATEHFQGGRIERA